MELEAHKFVKQEYFDKIINSKVCRTTLHINLFIQIYFQCQVAIVVYLCQMLLLHKVCAPCLTGFPACQMTDHSSPSSAPGSGFCTHLMVPIFPQWVIRCWNLLRTAFLWVHISSPQPLIKGYNLTNIQCLITIKEPLGTSLWPIVHWASLPAVVKNSIVLFVR